MEMLNYEKKYYELRNYEKKYYELRNYENNTMRTRRSTKQGKT